MNKAKPVLKWAGGKGRLLDEIEKRIPYKKDEEFSYFEPFLGGASVLIHVLQNYPNIKKAVACDINADLINLYLTIQLSPNKLISDLKLIEDNLRAVSPEKRKEDYHVFRDEYNSNSTSPYWKSVYLVVLNKTCFNGLYRLNKKGLFNTPYGGDRAINLCDEENIINLSRLFEKVDFYKVTNYDSSLSLAVPGDKCFFYLDPPYRPISKTSSFNSYSRHGFTDDKQTELKEFCDCLNTLDFKWLLSNSDPKNENLEDNFFEELYSDYKIEKVLASRNINAKGSGRKKISELLISN